MNDFSKKAIRHLELAIKSQPDHLPSVVALCQFNFEQKKLAKVQSIITRALREFDANATIYFWEAKLKHTQGNLIEAAASIEKAIALDPNQYDYHFLALDIHLQFGNNANAIESLERLIDLCPVNGEIHLRLAKLLTHPDDFHRAKLLFEISVELLPKKIPPLLSLASFLYRGAQSSPDGTVIEIPDLTGSRKYLHKALDLDADCPKAHYQMAKIAFDLNEFESAKNHLSFCLYESSTKAEAYFLLAEIELLGDEKGSAVTHFQKAVELGAQRAKAYFYLSEIYLSQEDFSKAKYCCEKSIELFQEEIAIDSKSAKSLMGQSNFYEARNVAESIDAKKKALSKVHLNLYKSESLGKTNGKYSSILLQALTHNSQEAEAHHEVGLLAIEKGDKIKARKHFLKALDTNWHLCKTHKELGILELESNDQEKAKLHLSIALDLNPEEKSIIKLLSKIQGL